MQKFWKTIFVVLVTTFALMFSFGQNKHTIELRLNSLGNRLIDPGDKLVNKGDSVVWTLADDNRIEWIKIASLNPSPFDLDLPTDRRRSVASGKVQKKGYVEWKYSIIYKIRNVAGEPILDPKIAVRPTLGSITLEEIVAIASTVAAFLFLILWRNAEQKVKKLIVSNKPGERDLPNV